MSYEESYRKEIYEMWESTVGMELNSKWRMLSKGIVEWLLSLLSVRVKRGGWSMRS
jgi:hypothetical protein